MFKKLIQPLVSAFGTSETLIYAGAGGLIGGYFYYSVNNLWDWKAQTADLRRRRPADSLDRPEPGAVAVGLDLAPWAPWRRTRAPPRCWWSPSFVC